MIGSSGHLVAVCRELCIAFQKATFLNNERSAKLLNCSDKNVGGLPASIRQALQFLRARKYPTKAWLRPFALQLSRLGAPFVSLLRALRRVLHSGEFPLLETGGT